MVKKKSTRKLNVYANLANKRKTKKDGKARKKAEHMASLPKHPVKRFFYRLQPKRFFAFWFSKDGLILGLKIFGVAVLLVVLMAGVLFAYFRKDLEKIKPSELAKSVQSTVVTYYDRNGKVLWEDKGGGDYRLAVNSDEITDYMKQATVAIEDKEFYKHKGVSISGLARAVVNNAMGGSTQGGSTLTQQLVKQVFFAEEAADRGLGGVPRKIKEMILSIEVERMYDKDQILTLYLNQSPYGGRRNGVESAARTYFGVAASKLSLAQSALLAGVPNQPGLYNPYNTDGHEALIARQHKVLDGMVEMGYITRAEADTAKEVPVLDQLKPISDQYAGIKAPHFLLGTVRQELTAQLGEAVVGKGGLKVYTTLDSKIQNKLQETIKGTFNGEITSGSCAWINCSQYAGFDNGAAVVEDTQTGQIVALVGSRDFSYPGFGQDDAATAYIQPGSSIKPLVYAELFGNKGDDVQNYGSGSILADNRDKTLEEAYGGKINNADRSYKGSIPIRLSLGLSRNVPAIKAMYISGVDKTLETIRALGNTGYCTQEQYVGLASAIGGCGARMTEHTNAFASLGRMGVYKPQVSILEVKNSDDDVLYEYQDNKGTQVIDPQQAYIVSDILSDTSVQLTRLAIPGVKLAIKTGTSDRDGEARDIWNVAYTPALTMSVWLGNHDGAKLSKGTSSIPFNVLGPVMEYAHKEVYAKEGKWSSAKGGSWFTRPDGIQTIGGELYPSWYNKSQGISKSKVTFDRVSKKKATDCTPPAARIELEVQKYKDPITKKDAYIAPSGYNYNEEDDAHSCSDTEPSINSISAHETGNSGVYKITVNVTRGNNSISSVTISVGGQELTASGSGGNGSYTANYTPTSSGVQQMKVTVTDTKYYTASGSTSDTFEVDD